MWCDSTRVVAAGHVVTTMSMSIQKQLFCEWILSIAYDEEILQEYTALAIGHWKSAVEVIMGIANTDTQLPKAFCYEPVEVDIDTEYSEYCKIMLMEEELRDDLVVWICRLEPVIESRSAEAMNRWIHRREAMVCVSSTLSLLSLTKLAASIWTACDGGVRQQRDHGYYWPAHNWYHPES